MDWLNENIYELILLIGILFLSIGFFMLSLETGFIGTGTVIILFCCILWKANQEGGD